MTVLLGAADTIASEMDGGQLRRGIDNAVGALFERAVHKLFDFLGADFERERVWITDLISFGPSVYNPFPYHDTVRKAAALGFSGIRTHTVDLGGASVCAAVELADLICKQRPEAVVLIAGADAPRSGYSGASDFERLNGGVLHPQFEAPCGATLLGSYALLARRLLHDHNIDEESLRRIAAFYRKVVQTNPRAANFGKTISDRDFSRLLADPYSSPMMALATDHGFAALACSETKARSLARKSLRLPAPPVKILGTGVQVQCEYFVQKAPGSSPAAGAAAAAFAASGIEPGEIDYAWIYDCFTAMTIAQAAQYFRIDPAHAATSLQAGELKLGKRAIPVNRGGGIANYQAAINIAGAAGLIDVLAQFDLCADGQAQKAGSPTLALLGGNGGIDTMNAVAILGRPERPPLAPRDHQSSVAALPPLNHAGFKPGEEGLLYSATVIRFNPGKRKETPYALGLVRLPNDRLVMARLADGGGHSLDSIDQLALDGSRLRLSLRSGVPWADVLD